MVKIDTTPPNSTILSPDNESWFGTDFDIDVYDIDETSNLSECYRTIDNGESSLWGTRPCNSGFTITVGAGMDCDNQGMGNCTVDVYAKDNASNTGPADIRVYGIDFENATCTMNPLPEWSGMVFNISWNGSDNLSGVMHYDIQTNRTGTWEYVPDGYHTNKTSLNYTVPVEYETYYFRCIATDYANNTGPPSNIVNTSVDGSGPITWFIEPSRLWVNSKSFNVSWSGFDPGSNITCYDVMWREIGSTVWDYIQYDSSDTNCTNETTIVFDNTTTPVTDGVTYYFQVRAWDNAGNNGTWSQVNTTVDTILPEVNVTSIRIGDASINITSSATDNISGVGNHTIYWETKELNESEECGSAAPGETSICSIIRDYVLSLKYNVTVIERAGTSVTQIFLVGRMVNFASNSLFLVIGSSYNMRVYATNIESDVDNFTLELSGTYPSGLARFMDLSPWDFDFDITSDGRQLTVYDMEQYNETSFFVSIMSSDADELGETLIVNATSWRYGDEESDQLSIIVGYPVIFPGLNEWGVAVLIVLSILIYHIRISRK
jgi:hypothetical protein